MNFAATVILIPTYNERENVLALISRITDFMPDASVLVIDDNSPDGTGAAIRTLMAANSRVNLLSRPKKEGLGRAYLDAFRTVLRDNKVEWVVMMDADHSHDPQYLPAMRAVVDSSDIVIGSRYIRGGGTLGWELWRKLLSRYANVYCRIITGMPVADATAGFNMLRASFLRAVPLEKLSSSGYAFQIELKYLLHRHHARFAEVPIIFKERREGESKISRHIISEGLIAPWKMRFRR